MSKLTAIINVDILTMNNNKEIIKDGAVVYKDNKIVYVGESNLSGIFSEEELEIIDGKKGILMPGMINCHTHVSMIMFRSLADDSANRLKKYIFPLEQKLVDKELTYIGAKYGISEMLLGGVTTFCDMYYFEDEVAKAAKELNIRGVLCESVVDFLSPDSNEAFGGLGYSEWFIKKWKDDELITPGVAPHAPYTNTNESLKKAYDISKKYDSAFTMHLAEMDFEEEECRKKYNLSPVEYVNELKILDSNFISAHTVLVDDNDIDLLKSKNVKVSHNVSANAKGAKGVAPILKMIEKGIDVGLGTDGPMSSNTLDIISQMSQVGKIHKLFNKDRSVLKSVDIVEMATIGGAKVLGMNDYIGSIEVGKKADLVLIETKSVNMQPIYDYYATLVYSANPSNVDTVIVNGVEVVKNKRLVISDFNEIRNDLLKYKEKIEKISKSM